MLMLMLILELELIPGAGVESSRRSLCRSEARIIHWLATDVLGPTAISLPTHLSMYFILGLSLQSIPVNQCFRVCATPCLTLPPARDKKAPSSFTSQFIHRSVTAN